MVYVRRRIKGETEENSVMAGFTEKMIEKDLKNKTGRGVEKA